MVPNSIGQRFTLTTFGESHGEAIGGVIDGCPAGIAINQSLVESELSRRRGGQQDGSTRRKEPDNVEWLSGIYEGKTLGTPIAFLIRNADTRSEDYEALRGWMRPGHADYTYEERYGHRDHRGGGRSSGRETAARVVAGAIAKQILDTYGILIESSCDRVRCTENIGGTVCCRIMGVRPGIGDPVFDKINARLAYAMMSIPSAISFEMGIGKEATEMNGKQFADAWSEGTAAQPTQTNHCGGVQGGLSNGMPIEFAVGFHPVVTQSEMICRNAEGELKQIEIGGRHDLCHVERASAVVEAMAALTIADYII